MKVCIYPSTSAPDGLSSREGAALIDTGASCSGICKSVAEDLHYNPVDFIDISHASGLSKNPIFPVSFEFPGSGFPRITGFPLIGFDLSSQGQDLLMLLGRDFLFNGQLFYHGPSGFYEITIPAPVLTRENKQISGNKSQSIQPKVRQQKPKKLKKRNKSRGKKRR